MKIRTIGQAFLIISLILFFSSCFDDDFDRVMELENIPLFTPHADQTAPIPGNSGIITTLVITRTNIQITWTRASDDSTPQSDLQYKVVYSETNNINSVIEAETNGIVAVDWTQDIIFAEVGGLSPGITYYCNVIVMDTDGEMAVYTTVSATTIGRIFMFPAGTRDGNFGGRSSGDSLCEKVMNAHYPGLQCSHIRVFISIDSADSIANMPSNFGVPIGWEIVGPRGVVIAQDWSELLSGSIQNDLSTALFISDHWWSGSPWDGTYDSSSTNCSGWTSTTDKGRSGMHNEIDSEWICGNEPNCSASREVLCIGW